MTWETGVEPSNDVGSQQVILRKQDHGLQIPI